MNAVIPLPIGMAREAKPEQPKEPIPGKPLVYLASPYTHKDAEVKEARYSHAAKATAWLIQCTAWNVFSPIVHSHPLAVIGGLRGDWSFWKTLDEQYLSVTWAVVVLCLPGWRESTGVTAELEIARKNNTPILYLEEWGPQNFRLSKEQPCDSLEGNI